MFENTLTISDQNTNKFSVYGFDVNRDRPAKFRDSRYCWFDANGSTVEFRAASLGATGETLYGSVDMLHNSTGSTLAATSRELMVCEPGFFVQKSGLTHLFYLLYFCRYFVVD